jgi:hypothetical protein
LTAEADRCKIFQAGQGYLTNPCISLDKVFRYISLTLNQLFWRRTKKVNILTREWVLKGFEWG